MCVREKKRVCVCVREKEWIEAVQKSFPLVKLVAHDCLRLEVQSLVQFKSNYFAEM